ncbi:MAG: hypothetical protein AABY22_19565, partial [Nanoarchaeota archaeon]
VELSEKIGVSLHPEYIFFWSQISREEFSEFLVYLMNGVISDSKIILPYSEIGKEKFNKAKRAMELLGIEHQVTTENIVIDNIVAKAVLVNLGIDYTILNKTSYKIFDEVNNLYSKVNSPEQKDKNILDVLNINSKFKIKDKAGSFIGSRMGRPEKAKLRRLIGSPNVLFPVGEEGGRFKSVNTAVEAVFVKSEFPINLCTTCNNETAYYLCPKCKIPTKPLHYCRECKSKFDAKIFHEHKIGQRYCTQKVNISDYFKSALELLGISREESPILIKGVKGTSNKNHIPEHLAKGILRAKHKLAVNKDGTIRYDGTETPITHFKPKEIQTSVEKLKSLGYLLDTYGKPLENDNQILELKPHDILIPACPDTLDEKGDDVFVRIAQFIDELLVKFYGLKPFYNVKTL